MGPLLALLAGLWLVGVANAAPLPVDDWPRYGHDAALTGRSSLRGQIATPRTLWSYPTGGREWLLEILPARGPHTLRLEAGGSAPVVARKIQAPVRPFYDLDGSGTLRAPAENYHERWAKILPNTKGWQRVAWNETWTDQKVCRLQLFSYEQGLNQPRLVWQSEPPEATIFQPLNLVSDLDGDGVQEICVAAHYRVMIFDGTTGRKESELRYHQSRPYGWFGLANVDGVGPMELITIGDFQSHVDVLNYEPNKPEKERLSVRWRRDIEQSIEERTKWPQVGPHPVADVAGDGRLELVLNLFNDTGDGQWHAVVLDASNGTTLQDFPRRSVQGTADIDADGKAELFLLETDGVLVPSFGTVELVSLQSSGPALRWSQVNAAWGCADLPWMETNWSTTASQGMRDLLVTKSGMEGRPTFLVAQRAAHAQSEAARPIPVEGPLRQGGPFPNTLRAMSCGMNGLLVTNWEVAGLLGDLQLVALAQPEDSPIPGASVRVKVAADTVVSLDARNAEVQVTESRPLGVTVSTPIAARLRPGGLPVVVVEGAAQEIFALQHNHSLSRSNAPQLLWRRPGRGMSDGSRWLGPLAADLDGDDGKEVIVAGADVSGRAVLVAYQQNGQVLWRTRFAETPGATPVWNVGALTFWWPGRFRSNAPLDLFVNTRRGPMHSDVGQLLDGRSGTVVWRQEKAAWPGQFSWGYAGIPPAVADLDGDGLAELISLNPVCFWVADGRTGQLKRGVELASRKQLPAWAAYGEPMVFSFTSRKQPEVLLDSQYILALLDTNGAPRWHAGVRPDFPTATGGENTEQTTPMKHALADLDGNGTFELASGGYGDGVRAIDPQNGKTLWSLAAPKPTCGRMTAADVDGKTGDELLYAAGSKLVAITADGHAGKVLWEWQGPASLSMPAVADLDGDGFAEIVVQAADGTVFCLGR